MFRDTVRLRAALCCALIGLTCCAPTLAADPAPDPATFQPDEADIRRFADAGYEEFCSIVNDLPTYEHAERKLGWGHEVLRTIQTPAGPVYEWRYEERYVGTWYGAPRELRYEYRTLYSTTAPFVVLEDSITRYDRDFTSSTRFVRLPAGTYEVTLNDGRMDETFVTEPVDLTLAEQMSSRLWPFAALTNAGLSRRSRSISTSRRRIIESIVTIRPDEADGKGWVTTVEVPETGYKSRIWHAASGQVTRSAIEGEYTYIVAPEDVAKQVSGKYRFSEYSDIRAAGQSLGSTNNITRLEVEIDGDWSELIRATDVQEVTFDPASRRTRISVDSNRRAPVPATPAEIEKCLKSTPAFPAASPVIQQLATEAAAGAADDRERVRQVLSHVERMLRYRDNFDPTSVLDIVSRCRGDCSEHAVLMVSLCRASGIPARDISGLVVVDGGFGWHAWVEVVLDGHWVSMDPTWRELELSPRHIRIRDTEPDAPPAVAVLDRRFSEECRSITVTAVEHDSRQVVEDSQRLAQQYPEDAVQQIAFAHCLMSEGRNAEALAALESLLQRDPSNCDALEYQAGIHAARREWQAAADAYQRAAALDPDDHELLLGRGRALFQIRKYDEARELSAEIRKHRPSNREALRLSAQCLAADGHPDEALAEYLAALDFDPKDTTVRSYAVDLLRTQKRFDEAFALIESGLAVRPDDVSLILLRGDLKKETAGVESALLEYQAAFERAPDDPACCNTYLGELQSLQRYADVISLCDAALASRPAFTSLYNLRGLAKDANGDDLGALEDFTRAIELNPSQVTYWINKAMLLIDQQRHAEAITLLDAGLDANPNSAELLNRRGRTRQEDNDPEGALADLERATTLSPETVEYWMDHASLLRSTGRANDAIQLMDGALDLHPESAELFNQRGLARDDANDDLGAVDDYAKAVALKPSVSIYWSNHSIVLRELERYDEAVVVLTAALDVHRDSATLWNDRGLTHWAADDMESALADFSRAAELEGATAVYWLNKGRALRRLGRSSEAIDAFTSGLEADNTSASLFSERGGARTDDGSHDAALDDFVRATEIQPENAWHWKDKAYVLIELSRYAEAIAAAEEAIRLDDTAAAFFNERGLAKQYDGDHDGALADYARAMELEPGTDLYRNRQLALLRKLERFDEALEIIARGLEANAESASLLNQRGVTKYAIGDQDGAAADYRAALELSPDDLVILQNLALSLGELGRHAEAEELLTAAIERHPGDATLLRSRAGIREGAGNADGAAEDNQAAAALEAGD